jgi:hypothetical protein
VDPEPDDTAPEGDEPGSPAAFSPALGIVLGFLAFVLIGDRLDIVPRLTIALAIIAVATYVGVLRSRRR